MKLYYQNYRIKTMQMIRTLFCNNLRHNLYPKKLSDRLFDFNKIYENDYGKLKRVNLGAGPYFARDGWISADYLPNFEKNNKNMVHLDLSKDPDKLPFNNLEAIYTSHTIEHFTLDVSARILRSAYNSLQPGGYLRICVPNAQLILDKVRADDLDYFVFLESFFSFHTGKKINVHDFGLHLLSQPLCKYDRKTIRKKDGTEYFKELLRTKTDKEIIHILNDLKHKQDNIGTYHLSAYSEELLIEKLKEAGFSNVYGSAFMQSRYTAMREVPIFDGTHPWMSLYVEAIK